MDEEHEGPEMGDFEVDGKCYEMRFAQKRIDMYERNHKPLMSSFIQNGGAFSLAELKGMLSYGLREVGGAYVAPKQGMRMAEQLVEENGYLAVYERVTDALERDCGFLFRAPQS